MSPEVIFPSKKPKSQLLSRFHPRWNSCLFQQVVCTVTKIFIFILEQETLQKPKLVILYGHVSWPKQSHKNNVAVRNDCWDMETPVRQRVWSFGDHSTASAAAFRGEKVELELITQCHAVSVPTQDAQLWLREHKETRVHSLSLLQLQFTFCHLILPHTATKLLNTGLRHIHSVNSFIFVLARTCTMLWQLWELSMQEQEQ